MYQHVMVPMDGSELAECVLVHLEKLICDTQGVRVTLIQIVPPFHLYSDVEDRFPPEERERLENDSMEPVREYLRKKAGQLAKHGVDAEQVVLSGNIVPTLVDYAEKNGVELIMMSSHGRSGISHLLLGDVADKLIRRSCVPVLIVRAPGCFIDI